MDAQLRVVIASDHQLVRDLVAATLRQQGIEVVGQGAGVSMLVQLCERHRPDVAIVDLTLSGEPLAGRLREVLATGARVLVMCPESATSSLMTVLVAGASGYLVLSDTSPEQTVTAIRTVARGDATLDPTVAAAILDQWRRLREGSSGPGSKAPSLTPREQQILTAMAEGFGTKVIARRMEIAPKTVENHKARIFDKLGARNQAHAISLAISSGLLRSAQEPSGDAD